MPVSMLSTSLLSDKKSYSRFNALDTIYTPPSNLIEGPGMVLMKPTSITHSGTSATLGANGQVTFSAVTSLSLNGCFTSDFDTYLVSLRADTNVGDVIRFRYRAAGSDNSTANSYTRQLLEANHTSVSATRTSGNSAAIEYSDSAERVGTTFMVYGPYLAQPTAGRSVTASDASSAYIDDYASTHNQSTSYDGITFFLDTNNMTGALAVYGIRS